MSGRVALAAALVITCGVVGVAAVAASPPADLAIRALLIPAFIVAPAVGALIVVRQPGNRIGWLFCLVGIGLVATIGVGTSIEAGRLDNGPWIHLAAWMGQWLFLLSVVAGGLLFMTFPTGRLPSPRWRLPAIAFLATAAVSAAGAAFGPMTFSDGSRVVLNPYPAPEAIRPILIAAADAAEVVLALMIVSIAAAVVLRLRGAEGIERLQLKWFAYAVGLCGLAVAVTAVLPSEWSGLAWGGIVLGFGAALPAAAGIAILRYRLYDIDVVLRRTLVYGALIAVLGAAYVAMIVGLQAVLSGATGGDTLPVAVSTLATAALFGPARRRVREIVDRRFYRSRYDARRTIEAFGVRVRDEVELDAVGWTLVTVAAQALRPASVSIWLRKPAP